MCIHELNVVKIHICMNKSENNRSDIYQSINLQFQHIQRLFLQHNTQSSSADLYPAQAKGAASPVPSAEALLNSSSFSTAGGCDKKLICVVTSLVCRIDL